MILQYHNRPSKVLQYPNRKLKRIAKRVEFDNVQKIVDILRKLNASLNAQTFGRKLGLAAPQIGINKRIFIMGGKAYINPEWTPTRAPMEDMAESCYSLGEGKFYLVPRATYGWARYQGINGEWIEEKIKGIDAIVYQHELSHLDGKCSIDLGKPTDAKINY